MDFDANKARINCNNYENKLFDKEIYTDILNHTTNRLSLENLSKL